MLKWRGEMP